MFNGYIAVHAPGHPMATVQQHQYALEHRLVMSNLLGRPLLRTEIVHHLNGDKTDNSPNNLMLMSQSEHMLLHACERRAAKAKKAAA